MAYKAHEILELSIDTQFQVIENGLTNAKESDITPFLSLFNYGETRINEGLAILEHARTRHSQQQQEYGEQISSTATYDALVKAVNRRCGATWKIAKIAVTDSGERRTLGIHRTRKYTKTGMSEQFDQFYRNYSPEALNAMAAFGYTQEKIDEEYQLVKEVILAGKTQDDETSEAQAATAKRDEAIDALHDWCRNFYKIAQIALADEPQLMEKLGIQA